MFSNLDVISKEETHPAAARHPSPEGIQTGVIENPLYERGARQGGGCQAHSHEA
jgi:hypothetical protein